MYELDAATIYAAVGHGLVCSMFSPHRPRRRSQEEKKKLMNIFFTKQEDSQQLLALQRVYSNASCITRFHVIHVMAYHRVYIEYMYVVCMHACA